MTSRVIVVKIGGAAMKSDLGSCAEDLVYLQNLGWQPVIVYGGGPEISARMRALGIEPQFVNGLRITDETAMGIVKSVLTQEVGPELQAQLESAGAVTRLLTGEHEGCALVEPLSEQGIPLGYVGRVIRVNPAPLLALVKAGIVPLLACIGCDDTGHAFNVNGDLFAAAIARALKADSFVIVTDVQGIKGTEGQILGAIDSESAKRLIDSGIINGGMIPKVTAALEALDSVGSAHIISGGIPSALRRAVLDGVSEGTVLQRVGA